MITREEIEKVLGPIEKYSVQKGFSSAEDNAQELHTIFIGYFKVYLSEFEKSIDEDKYIANCTMINSSGDDSFWTGLTSDDLSDLLKQIKNYMDTR